jgi:urea transport system ATP-binding protein
MLTLTNIEAQIGGSRILRGVSLEAKTGQLTCLMGRNGVGKTTTLKTIMGLMPPSGGRVELGSDSLADLSPHQRVRAGIGYVPQGRDIFPHLTVEENLWVPLRVRGVKGKAAEGEIEKVLEPFPVIKTMLHRKGGVLSGGQQQQLAIARALLTNPKVLLLDEPTEGIQPNIIQQIGETLAKIKAQGTIAILLVEQYVDFAKEFADCFYIMDRGAVVTSGPIAQLTEEVVQQHLQV